METPLAADQDEPRQPRNTEKIKGLGELAPKFEAFGWHTLEIDGHDFDAMARALKQADEWAETTDKPTMIIANTVKGKGVSFMENQAGWHGKAPNKDQYEAARAELLKTLESLK